MERKRRREGGEKEEREGGGRGLEDDWVDVSVGEGDRLDLEDGAIESFTGPLDGVFLGDLVTTTDGCTCMFPLVNTGAWTREHHVKVHSVDPRRRVELHAEVDVLLDSKAKVACGSRGEVPCSEKQWVRSS